jgi:HK97 family phage portal protein
VRQPDGSTKVFNNEDMFHMMGMSLDGVTGVSVITYARESVGLGLAAESYAARVFSQDATPRGVLQTKSQISKPAIDRLRASWQEQHGGLGNVHKPAVLEEGLEWKSIAMTAEDAQLILAREFQIVDIARWFNVPLHMVQETTKATSWGTGIEQLSLGFVTYSLMPWLMRWEDTIGQQLIVNNKRFFVEFLVAALLRGSLTDRYNAYKVGREGGWLSVNDILRLENMDPIGPEGDTRIQPLNFGPLGAPPPAPAAPALPAAPNPPPSRNGAANHAEPEAFIKGLLNGRH